MSKLSKAPLVEVIVELRWKSDSPEELNKFQFLHGDMYSRLKDEFPVRENLIPILPNNIEVPTSAFINNAIYRFRKSQGGYPLYQLGPGLLSVNTVDNIYDWTNYIQKTKLVADAFLESYQFNKGEYFTPSLKFLDFFEFDFENANIFHYLKDKFHLNIVNEADNSNLPVSVLFNVVYKKDIGLLSMNIRNAGYEGKQGFSVETSLTTSIQYEKKYLLEKWLNESQEVLSQYFKDMTKGEMYNSFK